MAISAEMKEKYFRRQALHWLVLALVVLVAWLILWLTSRTAVVDGQEDVKQQVAEVAELPVHIESLGELNTAVPPIDFSTLIRDFRTYPAEFKDKRYFDVKKFTIQVMDVSHNDVIVNYLNTHSDRDKFAYFRYLDDNQNPRYILTYGKFDGIKLANDAVRTVNFNLPASVNVSVVAMADYLKIIEDYERADTAQDLASHQPRQIKLQATLTEIPVQPETFDDEMLANANESHESVEKQVNQVQENDGSLAVDVAAEHINNDKPKPNIDKPKPATDKPKEEQGKAQKMSELEQKSPKASAVPNVNTSKVPGSE